MFVVVEAEKYRSRREADKAWKIKEEIKERKRWKEKEEADECSRRGRK